MASEVNFFELLADATIFEHAFDKAIAKTKEFTGAFNQMRREVEADSVATEAAAKRVSGPGGASSALSGGGKTAGSGFDLLSSGGLALGYGLLGGAALFAGVGAAIQSAVSNYASFSAEVLRNSQALDMNAQELQTWMKIGEKVGLDSQSMTLDFDRFEKNLAEGATTLKATGVDLQQLGITSTNAGTAILQLADYFHTHTNESEKAAIATSLFGRSGAELIPILNQGSQAFKDYEAELQKTGVLLGDTELVAGARAQVAIEQLGEAWDGAKNRLLAAVLPGFTTFFGQLTNLITHNEGMFVSLGQTVDNVLLFITGLLAGLSGTPLADLSASTSDAGSAYDGLANSTQDASQGIDNATNSTKAAKDAMAELQAQTQLQIDAIDTEIQAIDDETAAYNDSIDAQKQALQDQYDQVTYVQDSRRRSGEDLVTYERRLEQLSTQQKIKALDDQKASFDRTQADKKRALDDERANLQRVLNEEVNSSKNAAAQQAAALTQPFTAMTNAANQAANVTVPQALTKLQQQTILNAQKIGQDLNDIFTDKGGARSKAAADLGEKVGAAFVDGFETALSGGGNDYNVPVAGGLFRLLDALMGITPKGSDLRGSNLGSGSDVANYLGLPGYAEGTISTRERLALISEGNRTEAVIPVANSPRALALMQAAGLDKLVLRAAGAGGTAAGGGTVFNTTFTGPVADSLVASRVMTQIQREARRKGLLSSAGIG